MLLLMLACEYIPHKYFCLVILVVLLCYHFKIFLQSFLSISLEKLNDDIKFLIKYRGLLLFDLKIPVVVSWKTIQRSSVDNFFL